MSHKFKKFERLTNGKTILSLIFVFQSFLLFLWIYLGVNPTMVVVFGSCFLGSTISLYTSKFGNKKKLDQIYVENLENHSSYEIHENYCTNCSTHVSLDDIFCHSCGFQLLH